MLILLFLWTIQSYSRVIKTSVFITEKPSFNYIGKFAINVGTGKYSIRMRILHSTNEIPPASMTYLHLNVYLDEEWDIVQQKESCNDKTDLRRASHYIHIPHNGEWSEHTHGDLSQSIREHVWFFVLSDCHGTFNPLGGTSVQVELSVKNSDNSHFSSEEHGLLSWHLYATLATALLTAASIYLTIRLSNAREETDYPTILLSVSMLMHFVGNLMESFHLGSVGSNGRGIEGLNVLALMAEVGAAFIVSSLFILLAWGWRIRFSSIEESDLFIPLMLLLGSGTIVTVSLSHLDNGAYHKYHDYEGFGGIILSVFRICFLIYFIFGVYDTFQEGSQRVKAFVVKIGIVGSIYFCSFPFFLYSAKFLAPYLRHKFITVGMSSVQILAIFLLMRLLASSKSSYYEISQHNRTVLPDCKFD